MSKDTGRFWFLTIPTAKSAGTSPLVITGDAARDDAQLAASSAAAIEIVRRGDQGWTLLVSRADSLSTPSLLRCVFAVANDPQECDLRRHSACRSLTASSSWPRRR